MAKKKKPNAIINTTAKNPAVALDAAKHKQAPKSIISLRNLCLILGVISLIVYANTLLNGYTLDDYQVIKENKIVTKGVSAIPEILSTPYRHGVGHVSNDLYRPLSLVMFAVEFQLYGNHTMPYHLINILLFAGCVILLFLFLDKLFEQKKTAVAFLASLLFALHPIHTEVVANIKSRDELLCFFFSFLCLNVFIKYIHSGKTYQLLLGSLCFLLSFLSKETVITFLAVIPLIFFFYVGGNKKRSAYITVCVAFAAIICLVARFMVLSHYDASHTAEIGFIDNALAKPDLPINMRISTAILILGYYLKLLFIPYPLNSDYSYNSIPIVNFSDPWVLLSLAVYVFLAVFAIKLFLKNHKDPYAFGILFFLLTMSIFSNIFFLIGTTMGERLLFFPSVGFCLSIAFVIEKLAGIHTEPVLVFLKQPKVLGVIVPIAFIYSFITINRNKDWFDNYTLYSTDVKKFPENSRLNSFLGLKLQDIIINEEKDTAKQRQLTKEAIDYLHKSLAIYPGYRDAQTNLGYVLLRNAQYDSAEVYLKSSLLITPGNTDALCDLAQVYNAVKKYPEAIVLLKRMIKLNPGNENAHMLIAESFFHIAAYDSAEAHDKLTLQLNPGNVYAINNLAGIYAVNNKFQQAIDMYRKVSELNPGLVIAYANMAVCYLYIPKYDSAIYYARKTISLDATNSSSYQVLASAYKANGNLDSAGKYEAMVQKR